MKKKGLGFALILLLLITCAMPVFARAGGGGSSGGGSSGGGSHSYHSGRSSSGSGNIVGFGVMAFVLGGGGSAAVLLFKARKARRRAHRAMAVFAQSGRNWDYREVQNQVEETYFQIQECWRRMDITYGTPYMSERIQKEFHTKLEWLKMKNQEVVQKKVRLLQAIPVAVQDEAGEDADVIWYLIRGKMTGFYINKNTRRIVRGENKPEAFFEYWKFIYRNGRWVLDEIRQEHEVDIDALSI